MQHALVVIHFRNAEEVRKSVDEWIASKDISFFHHGIAMLPERWEKVIASDGKYYILIDVT